MDVLDILQVPYLQPALLGAFGFSFFISSYVGSFMLIKKMRRQSNKDSGIHNLSDGDIAVISNRIGSSFQAIFAFISGLIVVQNTFHDIIDARFWLTNTYAMFCFTYFMYDTFSMFHGYLLKSQDIKTSIANKFLLFIKSDLLMFLHHTFIIFFGMPIFFLLRRGRGDFIVGCFYMMELSTPFIHARYVLLKLQMTKYLIYTINGVFVLVTFFACRILIFPFIYNVYAIQKNLPSIMTAVTTIPYLCNVSVFICFIPQGYWFYLILKTSILTILRGDSYRKEKQKTK